MPKSTIGYYAVRIGRKSGIYMNWEECKEQIHQYPGALYKKIYTKQQAEDYINEENYDKANILKVWTDGYCENNGKKNALASIGVFFDDDNPRNLSERLPSIYQTNNRAELYAAICALEKVNNEQDLIVFTDKRKGKSIFKHVRGHSSIYENKQADRLAYLGSQKTNIKEFNFPIHKQ
ncbi:27642_t:CDS:2, partial [Gigaspora margarita]